MVNVPLLVNALPKPNKTWPVPVHVPGPLLVMAPKWSSLSFAPLMFNATVDDSLSCAPMMPPLQLTVPAPENVFVPPSAPDVDAGSPSRDDRIGHHSEHSQPPASG